MKKIIYSIMAVAAITMASCGAEAEETKKDGEAAEMKEEAKQEPVETGIEGTFSTADSATIVWKGKHNKDEEFAHTGTMLVSGSVKVADNEITGGTFTFDVASLNEGDGEYNQMLEGHLQDSTFFNTAAFPTATFTIENVIDGKVRGAVELIGMAQEIEFDADIVVTEESVSVVGAVVLDLLAFKMPALVANADLEEAELAEAVDAAIVIEIDFALTK